MKKVILLSQQTPMWHFQSNQEGCCLRATEVKPKLDRFLLEKDKDTFSKFRLNDTTALDYKLSFVVSGEKITYESSKFRLFFGTGKKLISYEDEIKMIVFSLQDDLIEEMCKYLCAFFATHSFGTRQDKGFGFFFPKKENKLTGNLEDSYGAKYMFDLPYNDFYSIFNAIYYFHKLIRSGINESGCYYKSLMYFYAKEKCNGRHWDKAIIRHHFELYTNVYKSICGRSPYSKDNFYVDKNGHEYPPREDMIDEYKQFDLRTCSRCLFRDALGLASTQAWRAYNDTITITAMNERGERDKNFTRFKSPIMYRPVIIDDKCIVYIYFNSHSLEAIKRKSFRISNKNNQNAINGIKIYPDFSFEKYFNFIEERYKTLVGIENLSITGNAKSDVSNEYIEEIFAPFTNGKGNFRKV